MTETERAIERLREVEHYGSMSIQWDDVKTLLAEHDRLTTLRPASEHDSNSKVLTWEDYGFPQARFVATTVLMGDYWTPLPKPRPPKEGKS